MAVPDSEFKFTSPPRNGRLTHCPQCRRRYSLHHPDGIGPKMAVFGTLRFFPDFEIPLSACHDCVVAPGSVSDRLVAKMEQAAFWHYLTVVLHWKSTVLGIDQGDKEAEAEFLRMCDVEDRENAIMEKNNWQ